MVPNPSIELVRKLVEQGKTDEVDFVLAVGGGSSIDTAKAIAIGIPYDGDVWDFFSKGTVPEKVLGIGVIATTASSGSETSNAAILSYGEWKKGFEDDRIIPKFAIMNPRYTVNLPEYQTYVGIADVLSHLLERYFSDAKKLAADPKVLLCDEATSALDPKITGEILDLLKKINLERKLTIVIITHEMSVVEKICDRVAIIDDGSLAEVGDVKDVFSNPQSVAAKKLVFPSNPFDPSDPSGRVVRIVFDGTHSSEPFIANLVEKTGLKVNILSANTRSVGGIGYGQMIVELPSSKEDQKTIIDFFTEGGLNVTEVEHHE